MILSCSLLIENVNFEKDMYQRTTTVLNFKDIQLIQEKLFFTIKPSYVIYMGTWQDVWVPEVKRYLKHDFLPELCPNEQAVGSNVSS